MHQFLPNPCLTTGPRSCPATADVNVQTSQAVYRARRSRVLNPCRAAAASSPDEPGEVGSPPHCIDLRRHNYSLMMCGTCVAAQAWPSAGSLSVRLFSFRHSSEVCTLVRKCCAMLHSSCHCCSHTGVCEHKASRTAEKQRQRIYPHVLALTRLKPTYMYVGQNDS